MADRQTAAPSQWMMQTKRADFTAIAENYHISPVTARIIRNRDVVETEGHGRRNFKRAAAH